MQIQRDQIRHPYTYVTCSGRENRGGGREGKWESWAECTGGRKERRKVERMEGQDTKNKGKGRKKEGKWEAWTDRRREMKESEGRRKGEWEIWKDTNGMKENAGRRKIGREDGKRKREGGKY